MEMKLWPDLQLANEVVSWNDIVKWRNNHCIQWKLCGRWFPRIFHRPRRSQRWFNERLIKIPMKTLVLRLHHHIWKWYTRIRVDFFIATDVRLKEPILLITYDEILILCPHIKPFDMQLFVCSPSPILAPINWWLIIWCITRSNFCQTKK